MKPILIDFAPQSGVRIVARTGLWSWVVLAVAAMVGVLAVAGVLRQQAAARAVQAQRMAEARSAVRSASVPAPVAPRIAPAQLAAVNGIVAQLNLPWRDLRDAIALATPPSVSLLALEPDARKRSLRLTAEARGGDAMFAYIERLKQQELFSSVLLAHHEVDEQDANKPLRFELDLLWVAQ